MACALAATYTGTAAVLGAGRVDILINNTATVAPLGATAAIPAAERGGRLDAIGSASRAAGFLLLR